MKDGSIYWLHVSAHSPALLLGVLKQVELIAQLMPRFVWFQPMGIGVDLL